MPKKSSKKDVDSAPSVLIADDNKMLRDNLKKLFEREGFHVTCTASINDSINGIYKKHFDIIVLDMRMPRKTGDGSVERDAGLVVTQLMRNLSLVGQDAFVVVFTAFPKVKDWFAVIRAGAYYLPKIVSGKKMSEELVAECNRYVSGQAVHQREHELRWLAQDYEQLIRQFGGKTVAVVERKAAEREGLRGGKRIGNCVVFSARNPEELQKKIIKTPEFWRAMPVILDVLEEED